MGITRQRVRKAQPTLGDVHVNKPLSNISTAYIQDQDVFVADRIFPVVPVNNKSDVYYEWKKEDFLRDEAKPRAPGTESAGGGMNLSISPYACTVEAYHKDVDDQTRANADSVLSLDSTATQYVTQKMLIRRELRWINNFFNSGIWGTDKTVTIQWSAANSTPRADVDTGKLAIQGATGYKPNTLAITPAVLMALRSNSDVRDQFKYTSADSIDEAMLARYFGVDRLFVIGGVYTSTIEGAATQTTGFMAGKNALLCYSAPGPSLLQPTAGYTFAWSGFVGGTNGYRVRKFRIEQLESDRIEGEMAYDMHLVAAGMGYFFPAVVA